MSRKDTIVITVLINLGLLAILFATAVIYDDDKTIDAHAEIQNSLSTTVSSNPVHYSDANKSSDAILVTAETPTDEMDHVLSDYVSSEGQDISVFEESVYEPVAPKEETKVASASNMPVDNHFVEITVKRGDALEKIARANNTTVSSIIKENNLRSERLTIGQVLRVPVGRKKTIQPAEETVKSESDSSDKQYYIVKSGDSPWKIARQFNVKFEDLLTLNNLNEDKARNLKVGDKIRIK